MSEIYDYLRILFARAGTPYCPKTGYPIVGVHIDSVATLILSWPTAINRTILAPCDVSSPAHLSHQLEHWKRQGITKIRVNGKIYSIDEPEIPTPKSGRRLTFEVVQTVCVLSSREDRLLASS